MLKIVADIETDNLLSAMTKIHSLVLRDAESHELLMSCTNDPRGVDFGYPSIEKGLDLLSRADVQYWHNGIGFDIPAIQKIYPGWMPSGKVVDTLVAAQFRFAHIVDSDYAKARDGLFPAHFAGSHMLEAWGHRLGENKGEYKDWCRANGITEPFAEWRVEMQTYCEQDTTVTAKLVDHLRKHGIPAKALKIEQEVAAYLAVQQRTGWPFDYDAAIKLYAALSARREAIMQEMAEYFGWWYQNCGVVTPKRSATMRKDTPNGCPVTFTAGASYSKIKVVEFNPGSRAHIALRLQRDFGWKPTAFTDGGKPQVDESSLKGLDYPIIPTLQEFLMIDKRISQLAEGKGAWLKYTEVNPITGMHHIHGRVKQNFAITHRASHVSPNVAQVPKVGSAYGAECRALWTVPPGWVLVGSDASGLELRCLSHYMAQFDNGEYGKILLTGDIHTQNQHAAGLESRDDAKTFIYAYLYGAGDELVGEFVCPKGTEKEKKAAGKKLKARFLKKTAALGHLLEAVKDKARSKGYLKMPDGRKTYIRHQHAALNSLLQSAGAIICKAWIAEFDRRLTERFGPAKDDWSSLWVPLGWIHDEVQIACRPEIAGEVQEILIASIRHITEVFGWKLPLDGEAKVGANWRDTH